MHTSNHSSTASIDSEHIWHPYTSMTNPLPVYHAVSASGTRIRLSDGRELIDGMSSWWAAIHGYNVPELNAALNRQLSSMAHVMFGGLTHDAAAALASRLVDLAPHGLTHVFFSDSGSVAVEVAMKMALQYWYAQGNTDKQKFLTIRGGYHGDTFHAMSVCDPVTGMHHIFRGVLPGYYFAERPTCSYTDSWRESDLFSFADILRARSNRIAAVILEPIAQGAGGMYFYSPQYLKGVRDLCTEHAVPLICDEIATGFGRTGRLFACEHAGIAPDIMCVGKALTGGYMTLAATLTTKQISDVISSGDPGVFMHGPTFMANPLACSVASASIDLLLGYEWKDRIGSIEQQLSAELAPAENNNRVKEVRTLGAIGVVELEHPVRDAVVQKLFVDRGVWVRPFRRLVYLMPPYTISSSDLSRLTEAVRDVITEDTVFDRS